jgi:hypothetical protein
VALCLPGLQNRRPGKAKPPPGNVDRTIPP